MYNIGIHYSHSQTTFLSYFSYKIDRFSVIKIILQQIMTMERLISKITAILNGNLYRRNHLPNSYLQ